MHYVIKSTPDTPNDQGERVEFAGIVPRVVELSGRNGVGAYLPRRNAKRSYIATAKDSPGRALYGEGFIIEKCD